MTLQECTAVLTPYAVAFGAEFDGPMFRVYHRILKDVAPPLLERALGDVVKAGARFMPNAPELLTACEKSRRQLLALHPYDGCAECEDQRGYRTIVGGEGQKTVEPCPCKKRHQLTLGRLGVLDTVAALPGETEHQAEQFFPTVEQLPSDVRKRLQAVTAQKVLR